MSSLKNSLKSKKGRKKSSQPSRGGSGFIDLSPVIEHDEDSADILRDRLMGRQRQRRVLDANNQKFYSLDHNDTYLSRQNAQHHRDYSDDSDGGEGEWNTLNNNDFTPPFCKDGSDQAAVKKVYTETTQHAITDFVESTNAQRLEEEELLNRAIERREMLHNRITAIEVAKAEFDTSSSNSNRHHQQQQSLEKEKKKSKKKKKHHRHASSNSASSSSPGRPFDEAPHNKKRSGRKRASVEDDRRMDALSERIKKEASEFMNFESKFAEQHLFDGDDETTNAHEKFAEQHLFDDEEIHQLDSDFFLDADDGGNGDNLDGDDTDDDSLFYDANGDDSDESNAHLSTLIEEESQCSASDTLTIHSIQSSDSNMDSALSGAPTPSQLSRYSNMVRLGIPDVAVIRSMERDEITNPESVLQSLKNENSVELGSATSPPSSSMSPKWTAKKNSGSISGRGKQSSSLSAYTSDEESNERPLRDDPNYTKYFKMIKAKVPRSWVKRVLEVDGRDARILQLDPDRPLSEQANGADIDEKGNINWKNVAINRTESMDSSDSDREERPAVTIPVDIGASVKAELAAMTARAGEFARKRSSGSDSFSLSDRVEKDVSSTPADISSAAIAASNARLNRLKALRVTSGDADSSISKIGRRRENVDEIRRRAPPPAQPTRGRRSPTSSVASGGAGSGNQTYNNLPLKDDPRFSKYFQMIRSRVPRSWVERVIEVDDRDPAILDLDPNKSLASQVGDESTVQKDTIDLSVVSLGATERSSFTRSEKSSDADDAGIDDAGIDDIVQQDEAATEKYDYDNGIWRNAAPVTEIDDVQAVDDRSETSSITASQVDKPRLDLSKMSALLDRLDLENGAQNVPQDNIQIADPERLDKVRSYSTEEIENRVADLIERFGSRKTEEEQNGSYLHHKELLRKSQTDIAKLSNLLSSKINEDCADANQNDDVTKEQYNIENLPSLLTQVLSKMEQSNQQQETVEPVADQSESPVADQSNSRQDSTKQVANETTKFSPHEALGALFAKRAAQSEDKVQEISESDTAGQPPSPQKALGALFAKRAGEEQKPVESVPDESTKASPHKALEALFAKRAAQSEDNSAPILREDPEYAKYFKMMKLGMPRETVMQALERDGKDVSILDLDPELPLEKQKKDAEKVKQSATDGKKSALEAMFAKRAAAMGTSPAPGMVAAKPLKDDPEYQKYMKMLKIGMPVENVKQALERDGKDPLIAEMDPTKSYESQRKKEESETQAEEAETDVPLKDMPEYAKFFKMLKMGIPLGAVRQALQKEGKDPDIAEMDPNKSLSSQQKAKPEVPADPPLQEDPEYMKFFKMLKMGIPVGAVQNALKKEGKDPEIINMDPARPLSAQSKSKKTEVSQPKKEKLNPPKVARKRLHWNKIDESKLDASSFWNQAKDQSLQLVGLDIDNDEFANLFTAPINNEAAPKKATKPDAKKNSSKQKVQLIDSRRRMNGSILLAKFKVDYNVLAKQVNTMEYVKAEANELRGMMQLLPTKDESLALRSYLPPMDAPRSEIDDSINKLGECERYMAVMLDVPDANSKFECMVFRAEFESHAESIRDGTKMLAEACNAVKNSERFQKLLLYCLKLGNALNTGGSNEGVSAITLDSLLKLAEAKAFDRQTSVLHYLVSIVQKNDADVLKLSDDFAPVKAAERVAMDMLSLELKKMDQGIEKLQAVVKKNLPEPCDSGSEREEDDLISTPMGRFSISAASKIQSLSNEFEDVRSSFTDLLRFFGEDSSMSPEAFFGTINTFVSMFDQTHKELVRKEEAKARRKRIEEKQRLRKEEMASKKAKS
mmetsp:Transcript_9298/g.18757  ORF Transcript_9298/g.18757 Transcript_9298/m.18757 type:complete len:1807 (+) Transcript_9298:262-5682(+)